MRDVGRFLSLPGTALLVIATIIATAFIFAPARRRLKALEGATDRLGAGDLSARAPGCASISVTSVPGRTAFTIVLPRQHAATDVHSTSTVSI